MTDSRELLEAQYANRQERPMHVSCPRDCDCFNDFVECDECGEYLVKVRVGFGWGWEHPGECEGEEG